MVGSLPAIVCMHIQDWYILRACPFMANGLWTPSITRASPVYRSDGAWVKGRGGQLERIGRQGRGGHSTDTGWPTLHGARKEEEVGPEARCGLALH